MASNEDGESPKKTEKRRLDFNSPIWQETPLVASMKENKEQVNEEVSILIKIVAVFVLLTGVGIK